MSAHSRVTGRYGAATMRIVSRPHRCLLFAAMLLGALTPSGGALDSDRSLRQALHRVWQVQQGLPRATIYAIVQTADGYLWLGTQTGLVRFDGVRFLSVNDVGNGISLEGGVVRDLAETPDHSLWVATEGAGLVRVRDGAATRFTAQSGLPSDDVERLLCDSSARLWIGTSAGLASFEADRLRAVALPGGGGAVRGLCESKDGKVWVGGDGPAGAVWGAGRGAAGRECAR